MRAFQNKDVKTDPRSEMMLDGRPWSLNIEAMKSQARSGVSRDLTVGIKWACLESQSMTTSEVLSPCNVGRSEIKSMEINSQFTGRDLKWIESPYGAW